MIRRPPRSTLDRSSAASDVYKRQEGRVEVALVVARQSVGELVVVAGIAPTLRDRVDVVARTVVVLVDEPRKLTALQHEDLAVDDFEAEAFVQALAEKMEMRVLGILRERIVDDPHLSTARRAN